MRTPRPAFARLLLFCVMVISACSNPLPVEPTPLPTALTPMPPATPTAFQPPEITLSFTDIQWLYSPSLGHWELIGVVFNEEPFAIDNVRIEIEIPGTESTPDKTYSGSTVPAVIQPSGEAVFNIPLPGVTTERVIEPVYMGEMAVSDSPIRVDVQINEWRSLPDGRLQGLGMIKNFGEHLLNVHSIQLLLYNDEGTPLALAGGDHFKAALAPQGSNPFSATFETTNRPDSYKAFIDANPELLPPNPPLKLAGTSQREKSGLEGFYYLGAIENEGVTPWWVVLDINYSIQGKILGLDSIEYPFPINPGEQEEFVLDPARVLPPSILETLNFDALDIDVQIDQWKSLPILTPWKTIPVSISQFERIGSRLYLRGTVINNRESVLSESLVHLRVLDVYGRVRALGWKILPETLDPDTQRTFDLDFRLPDDIDLNLVEFDLRAYASEEE